MLSALCVPWLPSRSPHGECGLKYEKLKARDKERRSLPAWGVWIEIENEAEEGAEKPRRSPHGECGLKFIALGMGENGARVAPRMGSVD